LGGGGGGPGGGAGGGGPDGGGGAKEKGAAFRFRALIPPEGLVLSPMTRFPVCGAKRSSSTSTLDSSLAVRGKEKATYDAIFTQALFGVVLQEVMQQRSQNKRPPRSRVYRTALV
jgi:hypothetical protein